MLKKHDFAQRLSHSISHVVLRDGVSECNFCNGPGHFARECFTLLRGLRRDNTSDETHRALDRKRDNILAQKTASQQEFYKKMMEEDGRRANNVDGRQANLEFQPLIPGEEVDGRLAMPELAHQKALDATDAVEVATIGRAHTWSWVVSNNPVWWLQ